MSFDFSKFMKKPDETKKQEVIEPIKEPVKDKDLKRTIAYLTKTRKLSMETLQPLIDEGKLEQILYSGISNEGKPFSLPLIAFKIYNDNNELICLEKINPNTYIKNNKKLIEGNSSSFGFEVVKGKGENAMFFESTIDMLSYMELFNQSLDNHRLVSIMGCKHNIIESTIERNNIDENKIYICTDADNAGDNVYNKIKKEYPYAKRIRCKGEFCDKRHEIEEIKKPVIDENGKEKLDEKGKPIIETIQIDTGRIAQYKDWNDMLKDFKENNLKINFNEKGNTEIVRVVSNQKQNVVFKQPPHLYPQQNKQQALLQQPKILNKLNVFGNKIWNDATSKDDKVILSIPSKMYESIDKTLKNSCINFYAYTRQNDSGYTIAINSKDLDWFNRIAENSNPDFNKYEVNMSKPTKDTEIISVFKPENSHISNLNAEQIKGFNINIDISLKIAEICNKENVDFLLQVFPEKNCSQLRINVDDMDKIKQIHRDIVSAREKYSFKDEQIEHKQINNEQKIENEEVEKEEECISIAD